jgi:hypothetical protein
VLDWPDGDSDWPPQAPAATELDDTQLKQRVLEGFAMGVALPEILASMGDAGPRFWSLHAKDADFRDQVAHARRLGIELLSHEILQIADERTDPRHRQVRIAARQWLLSKLLPRNYGDKVDLSITQATPIEEMSDEQLRTRLSAIRAARGGDASPGDAATIAGPTDGSRVH